MRDRSVWATVDSIWVLPYRPRRLKSALFPSQRTSRGRAPSVGLEEPG